ncbi:sulfotransferase family 2 domain-containing protein [Spiribacter halobius]|nr:sulfotransferase family 2 domain-containing protein [Spiribacter halobius]UEX76752.1 sulfotransferase family protein [Spiribacter halobius]
MISHPHRCVFVHVPKTAGQSIERVFLDLLGLNWKQRGELLLRYNADPSLGPPRLAHLCAADYVRCGHLSESRFADYFSFSFVRNPWDRTVSFYKYIGEPARCEFKRFALEVLPRDLWQGMYWFVRPQTEYLYDNGRLMVDFVGRFERLESDFREICRRLELPCARLPFVNRSDGTRRQLLAGARHILRALDPCSPAFGNFRGRPLSRHARFEDYYDDETWQAVAALYRPDVETFGYR